MIRRSTHLLTLGTILALTGCLIKKTPDHLKVDSPVDRGPPATPPSTLAEAVSQLTRGDPLVRRPNERSEEWWLSTGGGAAIAAWREEVGAGPVNAAALASLEGAWRGSVAVALSRGSRLAELEHQQFSEAPGLEGDRALVTWLGTVIVTGAPGPSDVRPALDWVNPHNGRPALLRVAERGVMLAWLDSPEIPLAPVEAAMLEGTFDRLRQMPAGRLIVARAKGTPSPDALKAGVELLYDATRLGLVRAAADSAPQQQAARKLADELQASHTLALSEAEDPLPQLLQMSFDQLVRAGGTVESTGLGMVALSASRLIDACPDQPCTGLDRHDTLKRAAVWSPEAASYAWAWRLITAKDIRDQLEVAQKRGLSTDVLPDLADLIVGERSTRVPASLIQQRALTHSAALAITRGLGQPDGTQVEDALAALDTHISELCGARPSAQWTPTVDRLCASIQR